MPRHPGHGEHGQFQAPGSGGRGPGIGRLVGWFVGWLVALLVWVGCLVFGLLARGLGWSVGLFFVCLVRWLFRVCFVWFVGWLAGCVVVGGLVGWLAVLLVVGRLGSGLACEALPH